MRTTRKRNGHEIAQSFAEAVAAHFREASERREAVKQRLTELETEEVELRGVVGACEDLGCQS